MNTTTKEIAKLWKYLKMQRSETLVIRIADSPDGTCNYLSCKYVNDKLNISHITELPELGGEETINIVEMLDKDLQWIIPSATVLRNNKIIDY